MIIRSKKDAEQFVNKYINDSFTIYPDVKKYKKNGKHPYNTDIVKLSEDEYKIYSYSNTWRDIAPSVVDKNKIIKHIYIYRHDVNYTIKFLEAEEEAGF